MIRVGFDTARGALIVEGAGVFMPGTLSAELVGAQIRIWSLAGRNEVFADASDIVRLDGSGFANAADALAYVAGEMANVTNLFDRDPGDLAAIFTSA